MKIVLGELGIRTKSALAAGALLMILAPMARAQDMAAPAPTSPPPTVASPGTTSAPAEPGLKEAMRGAAAATPGSLRIAGAPRSEPQGHHRHPETVRAELDIVFVKKSTEALELTLEHRSGRRRRPRGRRRWPRSHGPRLARLASIKLAGSRAGRAGRLSEREGLGKPL